MRNPFMLALLDAITHRPQVHYGRRALVGQFIRENPDGTRSDLSARVNFDRDRQRDAERRERKARKA